MITNLMEQTNINKTVVEFLAPFHQFGESIFQKKLKLFDKSFGHESAILDVHDDQSLLSLQDSKEFTAKMRCLQQQALVLQQHDGALEEPLQFWKPLAMSTGGVFSDSSPMWAENLRRMVIKKQNQQDCVEDMDQETCEELTNMVAMNDRPMQDKQSIKDGGLPDGGTPDEEGASDWKCESNESHTFWQKKFAQHTLIENKDDRHRSPMMQ
jgi:hypothetical protein